MNMRPCKFMSLCLFLILLATCVAFLMTLNARRSLTLEEDALEKDAEDELQRRLTATAALKARLSCNDRTLQTELVQRGDYWVLRNLISGAVSRNVGCAETITYTTHGDYTFLGNLTTLVTRWRAPISLAVFAPGRDLNATLTVVQYLRNCVSEQLLIRQYVSLHVYFPTAHVPPTLPLNGSTALAWPYDCRRPNVPFGQMTRKPMYRHEHGLTYPINVGRNVARQSANTHFVFASDIELFPSPGLVSQFLEMVTNDPDLAAADQRHVFPLAAFELENGVSLPETKSDLVRLLHTKSAIPFHYNICRECHLVPEQGNWVNASDQPQLSVFARSKREGAYQHWEPFYISDNREPLFDERVTWEGRSDKRIQNYAMCLLGYEYRVLHPAFLVHSPGIKNTAVDQRQQENIVKHVERTNRLITDIIKPEYKKIFGQNLACTV